jgi:hypothetical protein
VNTLRETSDRTFETKLQGGPGTLGPGGKGRQFNRTDWKGRRNQNQQGNRGDRRQQQDRGDRGDRGNRGDRDDHRGDRGDRGHRGDREDREHQGEHAHAQPVAAF